MTDRTPTDAFARAASALVREHDVTDVVTTLISDARESLAAAAIGLILASGDGELEVLAATSHRAEELKLYQTQQREGPCFDAVTTGEEVRESGADAIAARWPTVGPLITALGYGSVHASPLRWGAKVLGAMNIFFGPENPDGAGADSLARLGQAFADIATLVIVAPEDVSDREVDRRAEEALQGRTVIEQAKGVLAYAEGLALDLAYERLRWRSSQDGTTLTQTAAEILTEAQHRPGGARVAPPA